MATKPRDKAQEPEKTQEPDKAQGQQTGGTHDNVTAADVHVEPKRAEELYGDRDDVRIPEPVVGGRDATQDKVDYAAKAELEVPAADTTEGMPPLDAFIRKHEDLAAERGAVVVEISHPAAGERSGIYQGRDGGIRLSKGAAGVKYSDGTTGK